MSRFVHFPRSIFGKLLLSNGVLILSMSLIGFLSFFTAKNLINTHIRQSNLNTLNQIHKNLGILIDQVITVVSLFDHNNALEDQLTRDTPGPFDRLKNIDTVESQIRKYSFAYDWLRYETILLGVNGNVYSPDGESELAPGALRQLDWYRRGVQNQQQIFWRSTHPSLINRAKKVFTAVKTLHNPFSRHYYGTLLLSINESCLYDIYRDSLDRKSQFAIVDAAGRVISHSTRSRIGSRLNLKPFAKLLSGPDDAHQIIRINRLKYLCIYQKVEKVNWILLHMIPLATISKDINALSVKILTISLLCIVFSVGLALVISRKIALPLINLKNRVKNYPPKSAPLPENTVSDEITVLTKEYENIIAELEKTIHHLMKEQEEKRKAELHALQMQIRPHFLYNTINSIKCLLWTGKTELIEPTIHALVNLLEQTVSRKEELIPLAAELKCVQDYLYLQEIRSDRTIRFQAKVPESLQNCLIPKLLLQPLIENAIFHGFEPKPSGKIWGTIAIYCSAVGDDLQLEVLDDGVGMARDTAARLLTVDSPETSSRFNGIGVKNVLERIQLYFGSRYGLTIRSEIGVGTSVVLTLPRQYADRKKEALP
jgi:two-component system sensor histidine kinase YesM